MKSGTEYLQLDLIKDELEELKNYSKDNQDVRELMKLINHYKKTNLDIIHVEDKTEFMLQVEELLSNQLDKLYKQQIEYISEIKQTLERFLSLVNCHIGKVVYEISNKALKYVLDTLEKGLLYHYYEVSEKIQKDIEKIVKEGR